MSQKLECEKTRACILTQSQKFLEFLIRGCFCCQKVSKLVPDYLISYYGLEPLLLCVRRDGRSPNLAFLRSRSPDYGQKSLRFESTSQSWQGGCGRLSQSYFYGQKASNSCSLSRRKLFFIERRPFWSPRRNLRLQTVLRTFFNHRSS